MTRIPFVAVIVTFGAGCAPKPDAPRRDSIVAVQAGAPLPSVEERLAVDAGRLWLKRSGNGPGMPLILIHGGPGVSSFYLKPLEVLGDDRPVIRYDQLGSGKSDTLTDTTRFTIDHFVRELDSLRSHLGYDRVNLLGHSWGTIVALEYYRAHPKHVASLTLASAFIDVPAWTRNTRRLVATLSDSAQRAIRAREADYRFDSPDYQAANDEYFRKYVVRRPIRADGDSTRATMNEKLYEYMQGPSEFTIVGTLKNYDATPFLRRVQVPTLYTVGEFDEADPATIRRFKSMTPGSEIEVIPNSAHLTTWDNPAAMTAAVRSFLRKVDSTANKGAKK